MAQIVLDKVFKWFRGGKEGKGGPAVVDGVTFAAAAVAAVNLRASGTARHTCTQHTHVQSPPYYMVQQRQQTLHQVSLSPAFP